MQVMTPQGRLWLQWRRWKRRNLVPVCFQCRNWQEGRLDYLIGLAVSLPQKASSKELGERSSAGISMVSPLWILAERRKLMKS